VSSPRFRCALLIALFVPLAHAAEPERLTPTKMREDLTFLRDVWLPKDRSFSSAQRAQFGVLVKQIAAHVDQYTPADFSLEVSRAVALSGNGHTSSSMSYARRLPVRVWWFNDGLYVVTAATGYDELIGARVEKFGRYDAEQTLQRLRPYISGTDGWARDQSPLYLVNSDALFHVGASRERNAATLTLRLKDGQRVERRLPIVPLPRRRGEFWGVLVSPSIAESGRWPHALDQLEEVPLTYREPVDISHAFVGARDEVLYLRSNRINTTNENQPMELRLTDLLEEIVVQQPPPAVVLDLRFNTGGNVLMTVLFAQALPRLLDPHARIAILVGPATFSAAIVTVSMLKAEAGDRVLIVGEDMGDRPSFWSEGDSVKLPNSIIQVRNSTSYHDWATGCHDLKRCYWPNVVFGPKTPISLAPDIRASASYADYAAGRDLVLDAALAALNRRATE
jgi:hypothetical protein